jgi:hypothetical protein
MQSFRDEIDRGLRADLVFFSISRTADPDRSNRLAGVLNEDASREA